MLTAPEHEHTAAIDEAASWLALNQRERINRPVVPMLRERFGLSVLEAIETVREATRRRAHGSS